MPHAFLRVADLQQITPNRLPNLDASVVGRTEPPAGVALIDRDLEELRAADQRDGGARSNITESGTDQADGSELRHLRCGPVGLLRL